MNNINQPLVPKGFESYDLKPFSMDKLPGIKQDLEKLHDPKLKKQTSKKFKIGTLGIFGNISFFAVTAVDVLFGHKAAASLAATLGIGYIALKKK